MHGSAIWLNSIAKATATLLLTVSSCCYATQQAFYSACNGFCADTPTQLQVADTEKILAQAIQEALVRGAAATIAVVDRVGNVLALFQMSGASSTSSIRSGIVAGAQGLENVSLDSRFMAISKAITGAYLSTEGNAFSTRTASQIIQENFNPHERNQPGGPLFGVQFSQLPCGDFVRRFSGSGVGVGPQRSPLGLSADPGGFPLYKNGTPVGGVGVIADATYSLDRNLLDWDNTVAGFPSFNNLDELIATAATVGFSAPADRKADRITLDGRSARYSDATVRDLRANPHSASYASEASNGGLVSLTNYYDNSLGSAGILTGTAFTQAASGIVAHDSLPLAAQTSAFVGLDAFVWTDDGNSNRHPPTAGSSLTGSEVSSLLRNALLIANKSRAQIRRPLNSQARVTVSVVDSNGGLLGMLRSRDAPLFGSDVSLQKARTATFFSSATAAAQLLAEPTASLGAYSSTPGQYVTALRNFLNDNNALTGTHAFADRSGGNLSRPFYPDGINANAHGPLSKIRGQWSPFNTGLQLDLVLNQLVSHLTTNSNPSNCLSISNRLRNGMQIFPGSVPIYRGDNLIGGIGVSGDGVDQDDMIAFLAVHESSHNSSLNNAPAALRADTLAAETSSGFFKRLRYIQCPQNPFLGSNQQKVCEGK